MKILHKILFLTTIFTVVLAVSCKDSFLDKPPVGAIFVESINNANGVNGMLINAYKSLSGLNTAAWYASPSNWVWGGVRSDDAYKGSEATDQGGEINPVESYTVQSTSPSVLNKWTACYDGIGQANMVIRQLAKVTSGLTEAQKTQITAEARFIRGFHHFEAKRNFNKIPYVDEKPVSNADFAAISNKTDAWPSIEADLKFAYDNLPEVQAEIGRVNKSAAAAMLGKAKLFQGKHAEAIVLFNDVITKGKTNKGEAFGLLNKFGDVFMGANEASKEVVFSIQYTVGDGTTGDNANKDFELTNPHNDGPNGGCCGFYQPSQSLVNAFRTTDDGLPAIDTYNKVDVKNQESNPTDFPDTGVLDPRLDYTVGRIGVPYLDYGVAKPSWIRNLNNGGPWLPIKSQIKKSELSGFYKAGSWGQTQSGKNWLVIRYADVLLMAAECEVEVGSLDNAQKYVNMVRARAANDQVMTADGKPAAKYTVMPYKTAWTDKAAARTAVRLERQLELAMEGHRFYDLIRWGVADQVMNAYLAKESKVRTYLVGVTFKKGKDEYLPIPASVIRQSNGNIAQNDNY